MTAERPGGTLKPTLKRWALRGYGPLVVLILLFGLMVAYLPSVDQPDAARDTWTRETQERQIERDGDPTPDDQPGTTPVDGSAPATGDSGTTPTQGRIGPCADRAEQIPGDPYSPPCIEWDGENPGATARGVSADRILVSARLLDERGFQANLARLAGAEIVDTPEDVQRTIGALAEYFNERFHFYGREVHIEFFEGSGSSTEELLGGGQAEAEADAIEVEDMGAFAELHGGTVPFTDALARRNIVNLGAPYTPREYFQERHPYSWSLSTDCSVVAESAAEVLINQLAGKPATFAGPGLQDQPRRISGISPENPWYQDCHDLSQRLIEEGLGGIDPEAQGPRINYRLDISTMSNQAANMIARLKSEEVTTVVCGCDPIIPVFLTARAAEQNYHPEWIVLGTAGTDYDVVGQLYEQNQWSRAFGVSYRGPELPQRAGLGYAAYKTVRDDEPAFGVEVIYAQMYMLAIGIHMAGPNLTPETFAQGMFDYPGGSGMYGTWGFSPTSYTPAEDFRVIWWDPDEISPFNRQPGAYVEAYDGRRFERGELPHEDPPIFGR